MRLFGGGGSPGATYLYRLPSTLPEILYLCGMSMPVSACYCQLSAPYQVLRRHVHFKRSYKSMGSRAGPSIAGSMKAGTYQDDNRCMSRGDAEHAHEESGDLFVTVMPDHGFTGLPQIGRLVSMNSSYASPSLRGNCMSLSRRLATGRCSLRTNEPRLRPC